MPVQPSDTTPALTLGQSPDKASWVQPGIHPCLPSGSSHSRGGGQPGRQTTTVAGGGDTCRVPRMSTTPQGEEGRRDHHLPFTPTVECHANATTPAISAPHCTDAGTQEPGYSQRRKKETFTVPVLMTPGSLSVRQQSSSAKKSPTQLLSLSHR